MDEEAEEDETSCGAVPVDGCVATNRLAARKSQSGAVGIDLRKSSQLRPLGFVDDRCLKKRQLPGPQAPVERPAGVAGMNLAERALRLGNDRDAPRLSQR